MPVSKAREFAYYHARRSGASLKVTQDTLREIFVSMREVLHAGGEIEIPGVGRLRPDKVQRTYDASGLCRGKNGDRQADEPTKVVLPPKVKVRFISYRNFEQQLTKSLLGDSDAG